MIKTISKPSLFDCITRGYENKHHIEAILQVKEDKIEKFLEQVRILLIEGQVLVSTFCVTGFDVESASVIFVLFRKLLGISTASC